MCWQSRTRGEVPCEESFMFDAPRSVKAVWGYFGISSAVFIAEPGPLMLVSELCRVAFHFVVWRLKP